MTLIPSPTLQLPEKRNLKYPQISKRSPVPEYDLPHVRSDNNGLAFPFPRNAAGCPVDYNLPKIPPSNAPLTPTSGSSQKKKDRALQKHVAGNIADSHPRFAACLLAHRHAFACSSVLTRFSSYPLRSPSQLDPIFSPNPLKPSA